MNELIMAYLLQQVAEYFSEADDEHYPPTLDAMIACVLADYTEADLTEAKAELDRRYTGYTAAMFAEMDRALRENME